MILDFSVLQQNPNLTFRGLYRLIFQSLYHISLIQPKREIDEAVNVRDFRQLLTNKFITFFSGILAPHFQMGKMRQSDRA